MDWISDTYSQGYTNLQSLVECLTQVLAEPSTSPHDRYQLID